MDLILRAAFMFVFLWLVLRAMGKRELAQLSAFELVLLMVMGDMMQQAVTLEDHSLVGAVSIISTIALLTVAASWLSFRSGWFTRVFDGSPRPLLRDGAPVVETMRRERIRYNEIVAEARKQGIPDLAHIHLATLENDGRISFLRVPEPDDGGVGERTPDPPEKPSAVV